eukprot:10626211-Lingulodinium_polyedra.AAC.1
MADRAKNASAVSASSRTLRSVLRRANSCWMERPRSSPTPRGWDTSAIGRSLSSPATPHPSSCRNALAV